MLDYNPSMLRLIRSTYAIGRFPFWANKASAISTLDSEESHDRIVW